VSLAAWATVLAASVIGPAPAARGGGPGDAARPGAYCPLPEPGQTPVCLSPAQAAYGDFFDAVGRGQVPEHAASAVEADLRGASGTERAYLALSSISYGYYRLAEQLRARDDVDPAVQARLTQWNQLLVALYGTTDPDDPFRSAVREAAADLQARTPDPGGYCPNRYPGGCRHSEDLVRALAAVDDKAGVRSPLGNLLRRLFGPAPEASAPAEGDSR
jgi:hypothetical protein